MIITNPNPSQRRNYKIKGIIDIYIKTVIDIEKKICSAGAGRHFESEKTLLEDSSIQSDLWGGELTLKQN